MQEHPTLIYMNLGRELARGLRDANELLFRARVKSESIAERYAFRST